jgi:hypothetical protein
MLGPGGWDVPEHDAANGWDQYRREIFARFENLVKDVEEVRETQGETSRRLQDLEIVIANLRGRVFVWGTIAGTLFGAAISLFVTLLASQLTP